MRSRIVRLVVVAAVLAIAVFAVPFAVGAGRYYVTSERADLEGDAQAAAAATVVGPGSPATVIGPIGPETTLGVYDLRGDRVAGDGPSRLDGGLARALTGGVEQGTAGGDFLVAVPVVADDRQTGVLRASRPDTRAREESALTVAVMVALAAAAVLATWAVARRSARRMAAPLEELVAAAERLGDGDFTVRARTTGIPEIDALGQAQAATAARLSELVARERAFSAEASHQLRTPLAALRLQLEDLASRRDGDGLAGALATTDRLDRTVEDLLRLARGHRPAAAPVDVAAVVRDVVDGHAEVVCEETGLRAGVSPAALRQILAVLLENAATHGTGTVEVTVRRAGTAVAVDVADEGALTLPEAALFGRRGETADAPGGGHGIGLALARRLAEAEGGRLRLRTPEPTTFTLLLPASSPDPA
ncbi:HAMP domain-containing sensor histidine kinase [Actinomycetospora chlora]|uniref:HAMP domain-containing sensor histidine kinase n=1 Tax=Actinomycetospora chlora TaxID=663608 RepID=UPI0031EAE5E8